MTSSRSNLVSVGTIGNPFADSVSYVEDGRKREDLLRLQDIENKRLDVIENRAQLDFQNKQDAIAANSEFTNVMANYRQNDRKWALGSHDKDIAVLLGKQKDAIYEEQDATRAYLEGTGSFENALKLGIRGINSTSDTADVKRAKTASFTQQLEGSREELLQYSFDNTPKELTDRVNEMISSKYSGRIKNIEDYIASGASMTHGEKVDAEIRRLPPSILKSVPYDKIRETVSNKITGIKIADLRAADDKRVVDENRVKELKASHDASNRSARYARYYSDKDGKNSTSGYKEVREILDHEGKFDIGWDSVDNKKMDVAVKDFMGRNYKAAAVAMAIEISIDNGTFGNTFATRPKDYAGVKEGESNPYMNLERLVQTLDKSWGKDASGNLNFNNSDVSLQHTPSVRKDDKTLRRELLRIPGVKSASLGVNARFLEKPRLTNTPVGGGKGSNTTTTGTAGINNDLAAARAGNTTTSGTTPPGGGRLPDPKELNLSYDFTDKEGDGWDIAGDFIKTGANTLLNTPLSGLAGLGAWLRGDAKDGQYAMDGVSTALNEYFAPTSTAGKYYLENLGYASEDLRDVVGSAAGTVNEGLGYVGEYVGGNAGRTIGENLLPVALTVAPGGKFLSTKMRVAKADVKTASNAYKKADTAYTNAQKTADIKAGDTKAWQWTKNKANKKAENAKTTKDAAEANVEKANANLEEVKANTIVNKTKSAFAARAEKKAKAKEDAGGKPDSNDLPDMSVHPDDIPKGTFERLPVKTRVKNQLTKEGREKNKINKGEKEHNTSINKTNEAIVKAEETLKKANARVTAHSAKVARNNKARTDANKPIDQKKQLSEDLEGQNLRLEARQAEEAIAQHKRSLTVLKNENPKADFGTVDTPEAPTSSVGSTELSSAEELSSRRITNQKNALEKEKGRVKRANDHSEALTDHAAYKRNVKNAEKQVKADEAKIESRKTIKDDVIDDRIDDIDFIADKGKNHTAEQLAHLSKAKRILTREKLARKDSKKMLERTDEQQAKINKNIKWALNQKNFPVGKDFFGDAL